MRPLRLCAGALCGERIDQVHEEQTVRVLDPEHRPRMAARAVPLVAGEHDLLVPPASHARQPGRRAISAGGRPLQVQGVGVRAQVLRDRLADSRLQHKPDGVGRQFVLSSLLVNMPFAVVSFPIVIVSHVSVQLPVDEVRKVVIFTRSQSVEKKRRDLSPCAKPNVPTDHRDTANSSFRVNGNSVMTKPS